MKTIAHYFTSPKNISKNSAERQSSVNILFEQSNSSCVTSVKSSEKVCDNKVLEEKVKSCKKLEFHSKQERVKCKASVDDAVSKISEVAVVDELHIKKRKTSAKNSDSKNVRKITSEIASNQNSISRPNKEDINFKISKKRKSSVSDEGIPHTKKKRTVCVDLCADTSITADSNSSELNRPKLDNDKVPNCVIVEDSNSNINESSLKTKIKSKVSKKTRKKLNYNESLMNLESNANPDKRRERKNVSNSKKNNIIIDSDSDSSIEVFDTKQSKKKRKSSLTKADNKSPDFELDSSKVSPSNKSNNSLFSYFSKVDKSDASLTPREYPKIKVQALIHLPPEKTSIRSTNRKSIETSNNSMNKHKIKALMNMSDKIDVLSSEIIELCNSSSVLEPVSCDENVIVNDKTPNKKNNIESYFCLNSPKTPADKENTKENSQKKIESAKTKPWSMRVRITSQSGCSRSSDKDSISVASKGTRVEEDVTSESTIDVEDELVKSCQPLDKNTEVKISEKKKSVKVFSLFLKEDKIKRQIENRDRLEAKAKFLVSGTPENVKRKIESLKSETCTGSPAKFPRITHVQQLDCDNDVWNLRTIQLPLSLPVPRWNAVTLSTFPLSQENGRVPCTMTVLKPPENVKKYLSEFSNQENETAVEKLYKSLRSRKKKNGKGFDVWTDLYKPETISEIVGNTGNKNKLKKWLQEQKSVRKRGGSESSGDEFINSDSDGEGKPRNNVAVLVGPYGCGKTCSVYAIAQELGCEVLEINSSCNRNGKRLLTEFSEFTQSHNVDVSQSLLTPGSNKIKKKKKLKFESNEATTGKTSVLLVEDADILFTNHDEGFVTAISTLISASKRPVILTVNDQTCSHLSKFDSPNQLKLTFNKPRPSKLATWLRTVALVEGVAMSQQQTENLVEQCNGDVRRSLLQLQLIVQSKIAQSNNDCNMASIWWTWPAEYNLTFDLPTLESSKSEEEENHCNESDKERVKREMKSIAQLTARLAGLDVLSPEAHQKSLDNLYPDPWKAFSVEATYLADKDCADEVSDSLNLEVTDWLGRHIRNNSKTNHFTTNAENRWCRMLKKANDVFTPAVAMMQHCSHHAMSADYLPLLRTIGRAEQFRVATHPRRASRYFSYLKGLGIHANQFLKDFMNDCFSEV